MKVDSKYDLRNRKRLNEFGKGIDWEAVKNLLTQKSQSPVMPTLNLLSF